MSLLSSAQLAADGGFRQKIEVASLTAAKDVLAESITTPNHNLRVALAGDILRNPEAWGVRFAKGVVTNPVITSASDDNDLQFTVNSLFDHYATAFASR